LNNSEEYLLGVNQKELDRLRHQHMTWKGVTDAFLDRLGVAPGWRCLDVGSGPGFVSADLRERVGTEGEVTALDQGGYFLEWIKAEARRRGWGNVFSVAGSIEEAPLPDNAFDLIYMRWMISFASDSAAVMRKLVPSLRSGGVMAIQDYYYEGLSLYPHGGAFDRMAHYARAYYESAGGDLYVTAKVPGILRELGLTVCDFKPNQLAGGPESHVMEWGHQYFTEHIPIMAAKGLMSPEERDALLADWREHRRDPHALYFSPIVVDVAARKP
jgi:ubiquinone/menaquinone biosynthesis C-methylase UbiE